MYRVDRDERLRSAISDESVVSAEEQLRLVAQALERERRLEEEEQGEHRDNTDTLP